MTEHDNEHRPPKHEFYFGTHKLEAPLERMRVSELKEIIASHVPDFRREHVLVMEERGDRPDKPLSDCDEVRVHEFPHYYDQPPANFG